MMRHSKANLILLRIALFAVIIIQSFPCFSATPGGAFARPGFRLSAEDQRFLEDLSKRTFQFFLEQAEPTTGLVPDRARPDGSQLDQQHQGVASIAATGFGLSALCIAAERGWIAKDEARH